MAGSGCRLRFISVSSSAWICSIRARQKSYALVAVRKSSSRRSISSGARCAGARLSRAGSDGYTRIIEVPMPAAIHPKDMPSCVSGRFVVAVSAVSVPAGSALWLDEMARLYPPHHISTASWQELAALQLWRWATTNSFTRSTLVPPDRPKCFQQLPAQQSPLRRMPQSTHCS